MIFTKVTAPFGWNLPSLWYDSSHRNSCYWNYCDFGINLLIGTIPVLRFMFHCPPPLDILHAGIVAVASNSNLAAECILLDRHCNSTCWHPNPQIRKTCRSIVNCCHSGSSCFRLGVCFLNLNSSHLGYTSLFLAEPTTFSPNQAQPSGSETSSKRSHLSIFVPS